MQCDYLLIVSIFIVVAGCGVHTIFDQPVEVIPPDFGSFLGCLGQISAICVEFPQNHDVLYRYIYKNVSTIFFFRTVLALDADWSNTVQYSNSYVRSSHVKTKSNRMMTFINLNVLFCNHFVKGIMHGF